MVCSDAALGRRVVHELGWQPSNVFILGHPLGSHLLPAAEPPSMLPQILNEGCRGGESQAPLFTWAPLGGSSCSVSLREPPGRGDGLPRASVTLSDSSLGHCLQGPALGVGGCWRALPWHLQRGSHPPRSSRLWSDSESGSSTCWKWWRRSSGRPWCLAAAGRGRKFGPSALSCLLGPGQVHTVQPVLGRSGWACGTATDGKHRKPAT